MTSETSSSHSSPHTDSCFATSFLSRATYDPSQLRSYGTIITLSILRIRPFSILISWVNRFANSGANALAAPLRKLSPIDECPKSLPLLVDDWGGGGVWICAAVGARDWRREYERCILQRGHQNSIRSRKVHYLQWLLTTESILIRVIREQFEGLNRPWICRSWWCDERFRKFRFKHRDETVLKLT